MLFTKEAALTSLVLLQVVIAAFAPPGPARLPARAPVLQAPAATAQGDAFIVRLEASPNAAPEAHFGRETVRMTRSGRGWIAVIGVPLEMTPGGYALRILAGSAARTPLASQRISVRRGIFPQQRLSMPGKVAALYTAPGVNEERRIVNRAVRGREPAPLWNDRFAVPTAGRHSTEFGAYRVRNGRVSYRHRGVDIAAPKGQPVLAANDGVVRLARRFKLFGNAVVLDHGAGVTTLYLHMSALNVREGQRVRRGMMIGRVGAEGAATGPHLHWSLYVHGLSVSPMQWTRDISLSRPVAAAAPARSHLEETTYRPPGICCM